MSCLLNEGERGKVNDFALDSVIHGVIVAKPCRLARDSRIWFRTIKFCRENQIDLRIANVMVSLY
jgi:DNA invertase Pin-like site-specific DNA recombinase